MSSKTPTRVYLSKPSEMYFRDDKLKERIEKDQKIMADFEKNNKSPVGINNRNGFDRDDSYMKFVSDKKPRTHKPLE